MMASVAAAVPGPIDPAPRPFQSKRSAPTNSTLSRKRQRKRQKKQKTIAEGSAEEVLAFDIRALLEKSSLEVGDEASGEEAEKLPEPGSVIEVEVVELSSTGDGLAQKAGSPQVYVVPFTAVGDHLKVKVFRHLQDEQYSVADLISITKPSPLRDDSRIRCQYFAKCGGCQFQMLDYVEQLRLKRTIVEKAFRNFSSLPPELIPQIQDTIGSPLQYGYRTKLTPHFDGPRQKKHAPKQMLQRVPDFGFMEKATRKTMDIEDCPIATEAVRKGLGRERKRLETEFSSYSKGATVLLREDTKRIVKGADADQAIPDDAVKTEHEHYTDYKTCTTDNNATSTEYIDDFIFTNPAGFFFQNNNSILPVFTSYIREHIMPPPDPKYSKPIRYLIDAYSGSGLFTITLSSLFEGGSIGIDIADKSIAFARRNAELNRLSSDKCRFIAADAPELFKNVSDYDPDQTAVVLDPPRKGCDASFLAQLMRFAPRRVCYVSCNVHSQARDIGVLVRGEVEHEGKTVKGAKYRIQSLRGFDFFPQTGHVEGVAFLDRVHDDARC
jgi:tRNA (uracil-5-)-methyltransferase